MSKKKWTVQIEQKVCVAVTITAESASEACSIMEAEPCCRYTKPSARAFKEEWVGDAEVVGVYEA